MDPMTVYMLAAGMNIAGGFMSARAEKRARRANAAAYEKQREMARFASERELDIFKTESAAFLGDQISAFAKAGVDMSGSALMQIVSTQGQIEREKSAIAMGASRQAEMFTMQANNERRQARNATSFETLGMQTGTSLLNAYASYLSSSLNKTKTLQPDGTYADGSTRFGYETEWE